MASIDGDDLNLTELDGRSVALADEDDLLQSLIESFEYSTKTEAYADVLRHVKRAYRIRTTDLVGNDRMVGARVTFVDDDADPHRGIVIEPEVGSMSSNEAYDPRKDEMVDPSDYPLGTVQLIYGAGGEFGCDGYFFDRTAKLNVATSVQPATSPDDTYCYFAGWDYFDSVKDSS